MISAEKCQSIRHLGSEVLRISHKTEGFEGIPDKIFSFYDSVVKAAVSGAVNKLEESAKTDFEEARRGGAHHAAFFKRYNYLISCAAEKMDEKTLKVTVRVSLKKGSEKLSYVENVHFWDIYGEYMMSKNGIKKAFSERDKTAQK